MKKQHIGVATHNATRPDSRRHRSGLALTTLALVIGSFSAQAGTPNSFSFGIIGGNVPGGSKCVSSSGALDIIRADTGACDAGSSGGGVGFVSYDSFGTPGAYVLSSGPALLRFGTDGQDKLRIESGLTESSQAISMSNNKILNLANGSVANGSLEGVNGGQLWGTANSTALALGTTVDTNGLVVLPSFALANANTINSTTGAATNVADAFRKVDDALGKLAVAGGGLVEQAAPGAKLTVGKNTDGAEVDIAGTAGSRKLTNVSNGDIASGSKDAVNGGQLHGNASSVAAHLGGGSVVNPDGTVSAPSYAVGGATHNNVGSALTNLDGRTTQNTTDITNLGNNISNGTIGLVKHDAGTGVVSVAADKTGSVVNITGADGNRQLTGVANGIVAATSVDAVNGSQLHGTASSVATSLGGGSVVNPDGTVSAPSYTVGGATHNNVGSALTNLDGRTTQNTTDITNLGNNISNGTIGLVKHDAGTGVVSVAADKTGSVVNITGADGNRQLTGVANGIVAATSVDAINGSQLHGTASSVATSLGGGSVVNPDGTVSAPSYTVGGATHNNVGSALTNLDGRTTQNTTDIANLSNNINNGALGLVKQDAASRDINVATDKDGTRINMAGTAGDRVVAGVAAGAVTATSAQAVNGSQLHGLANSTSSALGGGSMVNADGSVSAPAYSVGGQTVSNVGDALTHLDGRSTQNAADITNLGNNVNNGTVGLVRQDAATQQITVAADKGGTEVSMAGTQGPRRVSGVERGVAATDAVNVAQLNEALNGVSGRMDDQWNTLNRRVDDVNRNANRGIAAASALINVTPYVPGRVALNADMAYYGGETALGVGISRWSDDGKFNVNGGVSTATGGGDAVVRLGVGIVF